MKKKYLFSIAVTLALLIILIISLYQISKSRTFQFFGRIVNRVETSEKVVALTFDDGPTNEWTNDLLNLLREMDVKATFFVIGANLERYPNEGRQIALAGHELGNHSYSHKRMIFSSPSFVKQEIEKTDNLIRATGYSGTIHFRPPYGKKLFTLPYYLSKANKTTVTWDLEPDSSPDAPIESSAIAAETIPNVRSGSIILLHAEMKSRHESLKAVKIIIEKLKQDGYRFVTVSELLISNNVN